MEHWEQLCPGGLTFVYSDMLFRPGTDSFLLGSFPRLQPGMRVCDLGSGTGLLGLLLLQRQRELLAVSRLQLRVDSAGCSETAAGDILTPRNAVVYLKDCAFTIR